MEAVMSRAGSWLGPATRATSQMELAVQPETARQPETAVQPDRERCSRREWCSRRQRFNRRQRGSRRQRCRRRQRGSCESSAATESGASREQTRAAERNQSGPRRDMIVDSGWDSRAAERPDEECCQGRAEVREGERHQQGEAGATQAKEAALIRRGRRCHERGEAACYVPDMNLHVGRPSAGARRRKTSARRSRIGASPRSGANSTRTPMPREGEIKWQQQQQQRQRCSSSSAVVACLRTRDRL